MNCCINCFKDMEIREIVFGKKTKGKCNFCGKDNTYIYNIGEDNTLTELFEELLDIYTPEISLPATFPREKKDLIENILYRKWHIFNLEPDCIYRLITCICAEKYIDKPELFDSPVGISEIEDQEYMKENSIIGEHEWNDFVNEIKCKNRFHTNFINKEILQIFLEYTVKIYRAGSILYRARISKDDVGFSTDEMWGPPNNKASAGRANPEGISCLYLANNEETTLYEIRAGMYDYVTVGVFRLLEDIRVVSLMGIDKISPFRVFSSIDYTQYAINSKHLEKISNEISKPIRRNDSHLDYLPTQYISDYIKSIGYDGIEYKSTMCEKGFNLAVFKQSYFECIEKYVCDVNQLIYRYNAIS